MRTTKSLFFFPLLLLVFTSVLYAQQTRPPVQYDSKGRAIPASRTQDTAFKRRDDAADSITIYYRLYDSTRIRNIDTTINDFRTRYPLPATFTTLGNFGTAARSLVFRPNLNPGWDPGFHAYDVYRYTVENTRFFQTSKPYTELGYLLGTTSEQMVNVIHTQNVRPNFNMVFQYRFINSPGSFKNQNTSHNNFRINGNYQSNNKRYNAYGIYFSNKLLSSENGGVKFDTVISDPRFSDRFVIDTRLGGDQRTARNFFNTNITTGNLYNETVFLFRQQYDLGQKDSLIVNDSTTIRLFYPRIRFQHTFKYSKQTFTFQDRSLYASKRADYQQYYNYTFLQDTISFSDTWTEVVNDFNIISFPEKENLNQFLKLGASLQNLGAAFASGSENFYNISVNAEYRNRTRNQKWNIEATGRLYLAGLNSGDYSANIRMQRFISARLGSIEAGFQNVNRTPSYNFNSQSSFPVIAASGLNKENITRIYGNIDNATYRFSLGAEYHLVSNYTYFTDYFRAGQEGTIFNLLHLQGRKNFRLSKRWELESELHLQQTTANAPVNVPLLLSINRIAYQANLYKNLFLATGFEARYHTPYKADNYSPFLGQYFYQNIFTLSNRPDINAFLNIRIKTFKAFLRVENLNALRVSGGSLGFTSENRAVEHYYNQGFWFRLGIWWTFIN